MLALKFWVPVTDNRPVDDLTHEFLLESQEGLDRLERGLTDLETCPGNTELLADIFRAVHTIKGATGFLGFARLEALSHSGENLLGLLRDGKLRASPEIVSALLAFMDRLREILRSIEVTGKEGEGGEDTAMIARLNALQCDGALAAAEEAAVAVASVPVKAPRKRRGGGWRGLPARQSIPPVDALDHPAPQMAAEPSPDRPTIARSPSRAVPESRLRETQPVAVPETSGAPPAGAAESTLRVEVELLNRMMNLVGELVLTRNQILQATSADLGFSPLGRRLDMLTADLREAVMKARMQPVSHVFSRFPRLVRDLTLNLGKQARLEMEGQETELDKSLLEAIRDPLTHAVRNAIDHGIEAPEIRIAKGKPAEGLLRLRACHEGSHVIVEVHDDGAGMDIDRIRAKALERGLVSAEKAEQMSEREIMQLVFLPGFSTAAAVTSVSGRGVGMDVVRNNVEKIGGKVDVESQAGTGSVLRLRIPLTLAIIPALIVLCGTQNFALPQSSLTELVHLSAAERASRIEWLENAPVYRLRGRLLPLVFLDRLLGVPVGASGSPCDIAILNADGHRFGLVLDGLADPEEIVVKPLAVVLREIGFYAGATILGNGEMALILNPGAIAKSAGVLPSAEEEEVGEEESSQSIQDFLVVESGGRRSALPLETVVRIERIPCSRLERAGSRPVLRIDGKLLPVDDAAGHLDMSEADPEAPTTVVVCRDGERRVGMTVSKVLDVAGGQQLEESGTRAIADGVTLLHERVTEIVNLASIPPLDSSAVASNRAFELAAKSDAEGKNQGTKAVCSVRVGDTLFGVPIADVMEILDKPASHPVPLAPSFVGGLVHYRGEVLTGVSLRRLLGMGPAQGPEHVLVCETKEGSFGLFVDAVGEVLHVSAVDHEPNPVTLESRRQLLFAGEWKLKDRLLVSLEPELLDPVRLARAFPA